MRLKMKNVDWKKLLLEKGERVALYVCLGIMGLMLVFSLFMPNRGFFSGSASANANELDKKNKEAALKIQTAQLSAEERAKLRDVPDSLQRSGDQVKSDADLVRPEWAMFIGTSSESLKRRAPTLLGPVEFRGTAVFAQTPIYTFEDGFKRIMVLRGGKVAAGTQPTLIATAGELGKTYNTLQKQIPINQIGREGAITFGLQPLRPVQPELGQPEVRDDNPAKAPRATGKPEYVEVSELLKLGDAPLAEDLKPYRMAIVVGSFPLKKQVENFQRALRLSRIEQVLGPRFDNKGAQFQFLGLNIERRAIRPGGKVDDWTKVDVVKLFGELAMLTGRRFADDKADLKPLMYEGLVMMRPPQMRGDVYPDVEHDLKTIKATLDELAKLASAGQPAPPPDRRFTIKGFNPFAATAEEPLPEIKDPDPAQAPVVGAEGQPLPQWTPPEHCLLRFLDVYKDEDVGKTFEYRIQVKMANPNYEHPNVLYPELKRNKELVSEWFSVKDDQEQPIQIKVPLGSFFYAAERPRDANRHEARIQFHRWLDQVSPNPKSQKTSFAVGDWVVADQVPVNRGEYLARTHQVEIPAWLYTKGSFILATNPSDPWKPYQIPQPFSAGAGDIVLVDFQGGQVSYTRTVVTTDGKPDWRTVSDKAPTELIYLSPGGKLLARDSETDKQDPEREQREKHYKQVISGIKEAMKKQEKEKTTPMPMP